MGKHFSLGEKEDPLLIYFIIGAVWMYKSKAWISSGVMVVVVDMVV
jgi:hypothetical protein